MGFESCRTCHGRLFSDFSVDNDQKEFEAPSLTTCEGSFSCIAEWLIVLVGVIAPRSLEQLLLLKNTLLLLDYPKLFSLFLGFIYSLFFWGVCVLVKVVYSVVSPLRCPFYFSHALVSKVSTVFSSRAAVWGSQVILKMLLFMTEKVF